MADFTAFGQAMYRIGRTEDPVERPRRMGMTYTDFAMDNTSQYRFMFMTPSNHERIEAYGQTLRTPDEDAYQFLFATVREGIAQGMYRPELADPVELAQMIRGAIHGGIALWFTHRTDPHITLRDPRETVRVLCDTMIRGSLRHPV